MMLLKGIKPRSLFTLKVSIGKEACRWVYDTIATPFGALLVAGAAPALSYVAFVEEEAAGLALLRSRMPSVFVTRSEGAFRHLVELFAGEAAAAPIELNITGTPFQQKVWEQLMEIPFGEVIHYGALAAAIGQPGASRAVGTAVGRNPIAYFIPCHRVLASRGGIGGYYWGTEIKKRLLEWESQR